MIYAILAIPLLIGLFLAYQAIWLGGSGFDVDPSVTFDACRATPQSWRALNREEKAACLSRLRSEFLFSWRVCRLMSPMMQESHRGPRLLGMWCRFHLAYLRIYLLRADGEVLIGSLCSLRNSVMEAVRVGLGDTGLADSTSAA